MTARKNFLVVGTIFLLPILFLSIITWIGTLVELYDLSIITIVLMLIISFYVIFFLVYIVGNKYWWKNYQQLQDIISKYENANSIAEKRGRLYLKKTEELESLKVNRNYIVNGKFGMDYENDDFEIMK